MGVRRKTSALSGRLDELEVKIDTRREPAVLNRQTGRHRGSARRDDEVDQPRNGNDEICRGDLA